MANVNAPYGLLPIQNGPGAASNFEMVQAQILFSDTNKIFRGDPVKQLSTGFIAAWTAGTDVQLFAGVFWGVSYLSSSQGKVVQSQFWPGTDVASTAQNTIVANIIPVKGTASPLFRVQSTTTGVAFADINANADLTMATAGSVFTGQSGAALDVTSINTTNTLPLNIVGLYGGLPGAGGFMGIQPGTTGPYAGSATGDFNWVIVRANTPRIAGV